MVNEFVVEYRPINNRLRSYEVFLKDWVSYIQLSNSLEQPLCVQLLQNHEICSAHHSLALIDTQILVSIYMVFDGLQKNVCHLLLRSN